MSFSLSIERAKLDAPQIALESLNLYELLRDDNIVLRTQSNSSNDGAQTDVVHPLCGDNQVTSESQHCVAPQTCFLNRRQHPV